MITLNVRKIDNYKEVTVEEMNASMTTWFLNEEEALDLTRELISAAEDLLPKNWMHKEKALAKIREGF